MEPIEQNIVKQAIRFGHPIPDRIANKPELLDGLDLYLDSFLDLTNERIFTETPNPIPWSSIVDYARYYGFDFDQTEDLIFHIRNMDNAYMKFLQNKQK